MVKKSLIIFAAFVAASLFSLTFTQVMQVMDYYNVPYSRAVLLSKVILEEAQQCPTIDPTIVLALIASESGFRNVVGDHGKAIGYMQIHQPAAWYVANFYPEIRLFLRKIKFDDLIRFPTMQIRIGYRYLCLTTKFVYNGNVVKAIDAYNGRGDYKYYQRVIEHQLVILSLFQKGGG